jgi:acyl-CoA thioesterase FadM
VRFGEGDPAGFVYTVVFSEYALSAVELLYGSLFRTLAARARRESGLVTLTRALELFPQLVRPDDEFDMTVTVADIRTHNYVLAIAARTPAGVEVFQAVLTPICGACDVRRAIKISPAFRVALERYRTACAGSPQERAGVLETQSH